MSAQAVEIIAEAFEQYKTVAAMPELEVQPFVDVINEGPARGAFVLMVEQFNHKLLLRMWRESGRPEVNLRLAQDHYRHTMLRVLRGGLDEILEDL